MTNAHELIHGSASHLLTESSTNEASLRRSAGTLKPGDSAPWLGGGGERGVADARDDDGARDAEDGSELGLAVLICCAVRVSA